MNNLAWQQKQRRSSVFIFNVTAPQIVVSFFLHFARCVLAFLRTPKPRYFLLSPPVLKKQILYDTQQKVYISAHVRDYLDRITLAQIYATDDYGTSKLKRHSDIQAKYEDLKRIGHTPLIIDCGGNIGFASKYFSQNYPDAKIVCIEPDQSNIEQAKINNLQNNADFILAAVGSTSGCGLLVDPGLGNNAYRIDTSKDGNIAIVAINDLLQKYSESQFAPFIIKIDIEGSESELFSKNVEWLDRFPLVIIELHDWMLPGSCNSHNFLNAIAALDRDFVCFGENVFSISNRLL
jgi:FkbM family methyltransferase